MRGQQTAQSDVDLLVISDRKTQFRLPGLHIQIIDEHRFLSNLCHGEDFEAWAVRLGRPLYDSGMWVRIVNNNCVQVWPRWETKVAHGARRLFLAGTLLDLGDLDAATEELIYALGHAARGLLLKARVFPLSRPELAKQVSDLGYPHLAMLHEKLRTSNGISMTVLRQAKLYSKKLLCHLDRKIYRQCAEEYRGNRKAKQVRIDARLSGRTAN